MPLASYRNHLVSVVIPSRGRPKIVLRAVRSALAQSFRDLEVIVVIDGPDEETAAALRELHDERLRFISLPESVGASAARNVGVQNSAGRWVALLDDDDEWLPTKIQKQVTAAMAASTLRCLVVCRILLRSGGRESIVPNRLPRPGEEVSEYLFGAPRNGFQTSAFFCERELLLEIPWRRLNGLQDIDWFLRVLRAPATQMLFVDEPLSIYWMESEDTITKKLRWDSCLDWGRNNRNLMTRKAYSCFIAKFCVSRAVSQQAGSRSWLNLLAELLFSGIPSARSLALFVGYTIVPFERRRAIGNFHSKVLTSLHRQLTKSFPLRESF
jgi:glycosyltransferase involved in cell wall biosynthesis